MNKSKFSDAEKQKIIEHVQQHGNKNLKELCGVWPDVVKRWMDPEKAQEYNKQFKERYHTKLKIDANYKQQIKNNQKGRIYKNQIFSWKQKKHIISMDFDSAAKIYDIDEEMYEYCIRRVMLSNKYNEQNKDVIYKRTKEWIAQNPEQIKISRKEYTKQNKDKIRKNFRDRKKVDPVFKLTENMRTRIWCGLKRNKKCTKTEKLIGCTFEQFKEHLEKQFDENMSWDNYGPHWHVDHIKPISLFDLSKEEEQYKAFHYTNCQPLEALENIKKSNKYEE